MVDTQSETIFKAFVSGFIDDMSFCYFSGKNKIVSNLIMSSCLLYLLIIYHYIHFWKLEALEAR